jgi:molybdopterin biosynthesis enzyme
LRPGETAWLSLQAGGVAVALPARFDGVVGGWCALVLPLVARLAGASLAVKHQTLTRKLVSGVGLSDVALLALDQGLATPLAAGDLPLSAIARADAFCVLPPGLEGYAAGSAVPSVSLDQPFGPLPTP